MTGLPPVILMHLTIPRLLTDAFAEPRQVKAYLESLGVWPAGVQVERWRLSTTVPGYEVEVELSVPLPQKERV